MSGSKAPLACVWHKERFFTAGSVPWNSAGGLALGFHAVKSEWIYHANSRNQPCVQNLYKRTFGATKQLATRIISMKRNSTSWLIERVWLCNNRLLSLVNV